MRNRLCVALVGLLLAMPASARQVAGVDVSEQITLDDSHALQLNGAGVRRKFFIKVYVGALYLPAQATDVAAVLSQDGARRVSMHVLYSEISAAKLTGGWTDGFEANLTAAELAGLQPRITQFNALFDDVVEGDVILLDYLPGQGTGVTIRGQLKGRIPGRDFNDALLRIWLGEQPADRGLKQAMLGQD